MTPDTHGPAQPADPPALAATGWEPVRTDEAGNTWEWSYRDGEGTRIIVGPAGRAYIEGLHKRIAELEAARP